MRCRIRIIGNHIFQWGSYSDSAGVKLKFFKFKKLNKRIYYMKPGRFFRLNSTCSRLKEDYKLNKSYKYWAKIVRNRRKNKAILLWAWNKY